MTYDHEFNVLVVASAAAIAEVLEKDPAVPDIDGIVAKGLLVKVMYKQNPSASDISATSDALATLSINKRKIEMKKEFNEDTNKNILAGFTSAALGSSYYYDSDICDQRNLANLMAYISAEYASGNTTVTHDMYTRTTATATKVKQQHDFSEIKKVAEDFDTHRVFYLDKYNTALTDIDNAVDDAALDTIYNDWYA